MWYSDVEDYSMHYLAEASDRFATCANHSVGSRSRERVGPHGKCVKFANVSTATARRWAHPYSSGAFVTCCSD